MPLTLYGGSPGSGKTHQVVGQVILPQIKAGRKILTTIRNVKVDVIKEYLISKGSDPDSLGELIVVAGAEVRKPNFYPRYDEHEECFDDSESIVKKGMMVIIDEAARYYMVGDKIPKNVISFFMEHRHSADKETAQSTDVILILPNITDLNRSLRNLADSAFVTFKLKAVGQSNAYTVHQFENGRARSPIAIYTQTYDKNVFTFYDSYAGGKGKETNVDKRQNILMRPAVIFTFILIIILFFGGIYFLYRIFNKNSVNAETNNNVNASGVAEQKKVIDSKKSPENSISENRRIAGYWKRGNQLNVLITTDNNNVEVFESPRNIHISNRFAFGIVDGKQVNTWSGQPIANNSEKMGAIIK